MARAAIPIVVQSPSNGSAIPGATVTVTREDGSTPPVYTGKTGTATTSSNALPTDGEGRVTQSGNELWLDSGTYQFTISGTNLTTKTIVREIIAHDALEERNPVGSMQMWPAVAAPPGWVLCQGQALSRTTYSRLFAAIGTTYGAPNASTFQVPDLRQRFPLGLAGSGTGNALGATGGAIDHAHTVANHTHTVPTHSHAVPSHTHSIPAHSHTVPSHVHSIPSHTHTVPSHTHTVPSHTHTVPAHTHTVPAHTHTVAAHSHTVTSHTHTVAAHDHAVGAHTHPIPAHHHTTPLHSHGIPTHRHQVPAHYHGKGTLAIGSSGTHRHAQYATGYIGTGAAFNVGTIIQSGGNAYGIGGQGQLHNDTDDRNHTHDNGAFSGVVGLSSGSNGDGAFDAGTAYRYDNNAELNATNQAQFNTDNNTATTGGLATSASTAFQTGTTALTTDAAAPTTSGTALTTDASTVLTSGGTALTTDAVAAGTSGGTALTTDANTAALTSNGTALTTDANTAALATDGTPLTTDTVAATTSGTAPGTDGQNPPFQVVNFIIFTGVL